ncbi:hypothetical protein MMC10_002518 [Thelotrema lepadinum]|nr:hypothetical protein [Thelotrema lepadinum]
MSSELMDTEAGGEQTQYEATNTVNEPHAKEQGTLNSKPDATEAESSSKSEKRAQGEKFAEKVRYGQTLSEQGFTGKTTEIAGGVNKGSDGRDLDKTEETVTTESRHEQGYSDGSGVGG